RPPGSTSRPGRAALPRPAELSSPPDLITCSHVPAFPGRHRGQSTARRRGRPARRALSARHHRDAVRGAAAGRALRADRLLGGGADAGGARRDARRSGGHDLARVEARAGRGPTAICGFSMGGLLALRLARLYPERISALVVISTPLRLRPLEVFGIRAVSRLPVDFRAHPWAAVPKLNGSDVSDPGLRYVNPGLRAFPMAALEGLLDLMDVVRADLPFVKTPTLVVHGRKDHTVPMEDSLELTGSIGSEVIE